MDEIWRLIHLVAAAFWLGSMILLAIITVVAAPNLDKPTFRRFMSRAGQAFAVGYIAAWLLIGVSGAAIAWPRLAYSFAALPRKDFGRLLETKTSLALVAVGLTAAHTIAGRRIGSRRRYSRPGCSPTAVSADVGDLLAGGQDDRGVEVKGCDLQRSWRAIVHAFRTLPASPQDTLDARRRPSR